MRFGIDDDASLAPLAEALGKEDAPELRLETDGSPADSAMALAVTVARDGMQMHFGVDPVAAALSGRPHDRRKAAEAARETGMAGTIYRADGRIAHNAGATQAQELGFALGAFVACLRMAEDDGVEIADAFAAIEIALCADQDQYLTTAKMRAMRRLHARLAAACGIAPGAARIHAETSYRMLTRRDPETNILRNTIAVFAAGIGGADSVSVLPHTLAHGLPDRFARRIARNTQTVLIDESHLGFVIDPSAGAGGIEDLTAALADKAWAAFRAIEAEGGTIESLKAGAIQAEIATAREALMAQVTAGQRPIVGTTIFPAAKERPVSVLIERRDVEDRPLAPVALDAAHHNKAGEAA